MADYYDVTAESTASRTYAVGLPVWITVHNDGTVTHAVDFAEAGEAIRESGDGTVQLTFGENDHYASPFQVSADAETADHFFQGM